MGIFLEDQARIFLQAVLVGVAFGAVYDVFRISRIAFYTSEPVIFAQDVFFFTVCAVVTFFFGLAVMEGAVRVFLLVGELIGAVLYHVTIGRTVISISAEIIKAVRSAVKFIFKWVIEPLWLLFYRISGLIVNPFILLTKFFKKVLRNVNLCLKRRRTVLYNQVNTLFFYRAAKSKARKRRRLKNEKTKTRKNA